MPNSIRFGRSGASYISRLTNTPAITAFTMMGWFKLAATGSSGLFRIGPNSAVADFLVLFESAGVFTLYSNGVTAGGSALTTGRWYHGAFTGNGTTLFGYLNGVQDTTLAQSATAVGGMIQMGDTLTADALNGNIAAIKVWNRVLTQAEIAAELPYALPVSRAGLNTCTPIPNTWEAMDAQQGEMASDRAAINRWSDWSGNGYAWTETGTIDTEAGPPIRWSPAVPYRMVGAAASAVVVSGTVVRRFFDDGGRAGSRMAA